MGTQLNSATLLDIVAWLNGQVTMAISPATKNLSAANAQGGSYKVYVSLVANGKTLRMPQLTVTASIGDTITGGNATLSALTAVMKEGVAEFTVNIPNVPLTPAEDITVTIANLTAPDGQVFTGGTSVITFV
jgi:hypothetical protein